MKRYLIDEILGKTIVIRSWGDMVDEYGLNEEGDEIVISDDIVFNIDMKHLCNREIKVTESIRDLTIDDELIDLYNEILYCDEKDNEYYICKEMIVEIK